MAFTHFLPSLLASRAKIPKEKYEGVSLQEYSFNAPSSNSSLCPLILRKEIEYLREHFLDILSPLQQAVKYGSRILSELGISNLLQNSHYH